MGQRENWREKKKNIKQSAFPFWKWHMKVVVAFSNWCQRFIGWLCNHLRPVLTSDTCQCLVCSYDIKCQYYTVVVTWHVNVAVTSSVNATVSLTRCHHFIRWLTSVTCQYLVCQWHEVSMLHSVVVTWHVNIAVTLSVNATYSIIGLRHKMSLFLRWLCNHLYLVITLFTY